MYLITIMQIFLSERAAAVRDIIASRSWSDRDLAVIQGWMRSTSRKESTSSLDRYHPYQNVKVFITWQAKRFCHVYLTLAKKTSYSQHSTVSNFRAYTKEVYLLGL